MATRTEMDEVLAILATSIRPSICPDCNCQVLLSGYDEKRHDQGWSWECIGRLLEPTVSQLRSVTHRNTHSLCLYGPDGTENGKLRRYQVTPRDLLSMSLVFRKLWDDELASGTSID